MTEALLHELNELNATSDDVIQAWVTVLAIEAQDVSTEDMRVEEFVEAVGERRPLLICLIN